MRRKTRLFLDRATNSLVLAIELFNRPNDQGRTEGVLLFLDHSFEMLLKAVVLEKTGHIRKSRERFNYSLDKCINVCKDQLGVLDADQAVVVRNVDGFRDAAMHDVVEMSEGLLYVHAQSAVAIFTKLLRDIFRREIASLPKRVLPVSTSPPKDIQVLVSEDMEEVRRLLASGQRVRHIAEARLKPYLVIEQNLRELHAISSRRVSTGQVVKSLKAGQWMSALPLVAGMVTNPEASIPVMLRVSKTEGLPVKVDSTAPTAVVFKYARVEDRYPFLTRDLADRLKLTTNKVVGLVKLFHIKGQDEFHTAIRISRSSYVQRYTNKTLDMLQRAIGAEGLERLWDAFRKGESRDPKPYLG